MSEVRTTRNRRTFLKAGGALAAGLLTQSAVAQPNVPGTLPSLPANPRTNAAMPTR